MRVFLAASLFAVGAMSSSAIAQAPLQNFVVHVEILGADAPRLQKFYGDLFGWNATLNPIGYGYVPVEPKAPAKLTGGIGPSPQGQPLVTFYVKVVDPSVTLKRAQELGDRIVMPPTDMPGGVTFARFADPEGDIVGLVRRPD